MEEKLTHWKQLINLDYIGAYSLEKGKDLTVTIKMVVREIVTGAGGKKEQCTVAHLEGQKPLILNRTNQKMITRIYGTPYIEEWVGKKITLYASTTKLAGDMVECLRIREIKPALPELDPLDTVNFEKVKKALNNGYTLDQIKLKWSIRPDVEKLLQ